MNSNQLRTKFLEYFQELNHQLVSSSSLVPADDPTLLFTNAGMVQFKDYFLGKVKAPYLAAVSSQRCVRAGGKHNDLENVGYTARHHTFFEMLGNFSFGAYFKKEAIRYAWNFLTTELKLPPEKLWITVFKDDDEAAAIWLNDIKIDPNRFSRCGEKDNFWSMGDTGPCGPCTEIFYDHGSEIPGGPPGTPEEDGDRYVEIWNLVFMQFNRSADGTLTPLPIPAVDTGMGMERVAAVLQGVHNNYDIDIFRHLIEKIAKIANVRDYEQTSLRVIADHIRSCSFLILDGVTPSNEGRGYVLRRIIRRAIRHGNKLGLRDPFFYKLVPTLVEEMGEAYPELTKNQQHLQQVLLREEEQFANTLDQGLKLLESELVKLPNNIIPGEVIFKLYDTYGFPPDLTGDIAREKGLIVDYPGFEKQMELQRHKSQEASRFSVALNEDLQVEGETDFTGHERLSDQGMVTALFQNNQPLTQIDQKGNEAIVILNRTPFYAEAGGQIGDTGKLYFENGVFNVTNTKKKGLVYLHCGQVESGTLKVGDKVDAEVASSRKDIMLNHTATHLLHAALRRVLGEHVIQKGSLVAAERLRFDFAHYEPLSSSQLRTIESLVNQQIAANLSATTEFMTPEAAVKKGATALFGEKYGDEVRVLSIGEFSMELCGGTHVKHTGEIGLFKITSETGIAAGIRRIEGVTGSKAFEWTNRADEELTQIAQVLKTSRENIVEKLEQTLQHTRMLEKELEKLKQQIMSNKSKDLLADAVKIEGIRVLAIKLEAAEPKILRDTVDQLKDKLGEGVILLASVNDDKIFLNAGVTKNCIAKINAGELVNFVAQQVGGKGGGRPDMAQGGGVEVANLDKALASVIPWVKEKLE
jgi:alanyl-tRNA synthetase